MPKQPESRIAKRIKRYLEQEGAWVFNVHGGDNPFQEVGIPDFLCCWRGAFVGLEIKQPGEQPSARQRLILKRIREAGGITAVVTSVEEVERLLRRTARKGVM